MPQAPAESSVLGDLLEVSDTLFAARVRPDGTILTANAALERWAGGSLAGAPLGDLVMAPQRPALLRALDGAGPEWQVLTLGFSDGSPRAAEDRRVLVRADGAELLMV